jgi:hypothetical protein
LQTGDDFAVASLVFVEWRFRHQDITIARGVRTQRPLLLPLPISLYKDQTIQILLLAARLMPGFEFRFLFISLFVGLRNVNKQKTITSERERDKVVKCMAEVVHADSRY